MSTNYKWRLTWSGSPIKQKYLLDIVCEHLKVFPLFRDSEAKLIDHSEYMALVKAGEIAEPKSYWQIDENEIGMISLRSYGRYTDTWERIHTAKGDFQDGWRKCKEYYGVK